METIVVLTILGTSIWVFFDAKAIGVKKGQIQGLGDMGPLEWLGACLTLWIVGLPMYLVKRRQFMRINASRRPSEATSASTT